MIGIRYSTFCWVCCVSFGHTWLTFVPDFFHFLGTFFLCRPSHWNAGITPTVRRTKVRRPKSLLQPVIPALPKAHPPRRKSMVSVSTLRMDHHKHHNTHNQENDILTSSQLSFKPRFVASTPWNVHSTIPRQPSRDDHDDIDHFPTHDDDMPVGSDDAKQYVPPSQYQDKVHQYSTSQPTPPIVKPRRSQSPPRMDGPLMQRLKRLRSTIQGDMVRLASGQYPCSTSIRRGSSITNSVVDRNDPRNRATSVLDVTIIGRTIHDDNHTENMIRSSSSHLVTVPCYVHQWTNTNSNSTTATTTANVNPTAFLPSATFTDVVLTNDTILSQNVRYGSQLRIYNAIYIPMSSSPSNMNKSSGCIVCTQLCEPYATTKLPALLVPTQASK